MVFPTRLGAIVTTVLLVTFLNDAGRGTSRSSRWAGTVACCEAFSPANSGATVTTLARRGSVGKPYTASSSVSDLARLRLDTSVRAAADGGGGRRRKRDSAKEAAKKAGAAVADAMKTIFVKPLRKLKNAASSEKSGDATDDDEGEDEDVTVKMMMDKAQIAANRTQEAATASVEGVVESVEEMAERALGNVKEVATNVAKEIEEIEEIAERALSRRAQIATNRTQEAATAALGNVKKAASTVAKEIEEIEEIAEKALSKERQVAEKVLDNAKKAATTAVEFEKKAEETLKKEMQEAEKVLDNAKKAATTAVEGMAQKVTQAFKQPKGERWAIASPETDLTGKWKIIATDEFKKEYDAYLQDLGQPVLIRSIALSIIGLTREELEQTDHGRSLRIKGTTSRGAWERTIHASGSDLTQIAGGNFSHKRVPLTTADSEKVEAEAWWEGKGTVHTSWIRGGKKYGGGDFSSKRYIDSEGHLICETVFHPSTEGGKEASVTWKFEREN